MTKVIDLKKEADVFSLIGELDALVVERETFEREEYARSNQRLYEILSKIYAAYRTAQASKPLLTATVKRMKDALSKQNERVQSNTLAINLFVRYVFRTDRQRAHNYSRTLQAAFANNIAPEALAQFVAQSGGVEECKKQFVKSEKVKTKEQTIADAMPLVDEHLSGNSPALGELAVPAAWISATHDKELTFLVAKADRRGNVQVLSVVPAFSKGMATWAKKQIALFLAAQQAESQKKAKGKRKEVAISAAKPSAKNNNSATETVGELLAA